MTAVDGRSTVGEPSIEPTAEADIPSVLQLLADADLPLDGAGEALTHGVVARSGGRVVGGAGLERFGDAGLLRSVVVAPELRKAGVGRRLVNGAERRARDDGIRELYLFTETAIDWFPRLGYEPIPRADAEAAVGESVEATTVCKDRGVAMRRSLGRPD